MNLLHLLRRVNLPDLFLSVGHLIVFCGLIAGTPWAQRIATLVQTWPVSEFFAAFIAPFLVWSFVRKESTPIYQRAIALPFVIIGLVGLSGFWRFLRVFWLYLLAKCLPLFVTRPTLAEHNAGVVRMAVAIPAFLVLAAMFLNRSHDPLFGTPGDSQLDGERWYLARLMLFGAVYFGLVGMAMSLWAHLTRDADAA